MILWWWFPVALIAGACVGAVLMGVCAYDRVNSRKKWWEDDNE